MHKRIIGLDWVKQLRNVLIQLQGEHLLQHLQKTNINIKERARPTTCNFTKKQIPSGCISRTFTKKSFL